MLAVIGAILPLALGIAISPIPIIAAILMLLSPKARGTSVGFLLGWVLGIVVAVDGVHAAVVGDPRRATPTRRKPIAGHHQARPRRAPAPAGGRAVARPPARRRGAGAAEVDAGDRHA